jgi:glutamyl-tRNA synthetase
MGTTCVVALILPRIEAGLGHAVDEVGKSRLLKGMNGLKQRARTLVELGDSAMFYVRSRPLALDQKAQAALTPEARTTLSSTVDILVKLADWSAPVLEQTDRTIAEQRGLKLGQVAQPKRAALTGSTTSPPIYEVMEVLGREETLARLRDVGIG